MFKRGFLAPLCNLWSVPSGLDMRSTTVFILLLYSHEMASPPWTWSLQSFLSRRGFIIPYFYFVILSYPFLKSYSAQHSFLSSLLIFSVSISSRISCLHLPRNLFTPYSVINTVEKQLACLLIRFERVIIMLLFFVFVCDCYFTKRFQDLIEFVDLGSNGFLSDLCFVVTSYNDMFIKRPECW